MRSIFLGKTRNATPVTTCLNIGGRTFTGLNFALEHPRMAYGDFNGDAMLMEFSDTWESLTVVFFRGMKDGAQGLFQKWVAGELPETTSADALSL